MSAPTTPSRLSHARDLSRPGFYVKLLLVMLVNAMGVYGIMACIPLEKWGVLAFLVVTLLVVDYVYFSKRAIPAKYLVPGLIFLAVFLWAFSTSLLRAVVVLGGGAVFMTAAALGLQRFLLS